MKKIFNPQMVLLAVGVLQPASIFEVIGFLKTVFRDAGVISPVDEFRKFLDEQVTAKRVIQVNENGEPYFSLTLLGSLYLPVEVRKMRDKFRAYLLRDSHRARFIESREIEQGLAGVSPALDTSSAVKGRAANKLGRAAFGRRFANGRPYWPRISGQFVKRTGLTRSSRDTFPSLLSFETKAQAQAALQKEFTFDYVGLGVCLGLSPQLIWNIAHQQNNHYRKFEIAKKGGGMRTIESPRVFLKVIQWFLADFVLDGLVAHDAVHSFSIKRSIATNAQLHVGRKFLANVDIENFFGSISIEMISSHLGSNGFNKFESVIISRLCTNNGALPQGAPTSPLVSNSILFDVDEFMDGFCKARNMTYSRYADDISVSGDDRPQIELAIDLVEAQLRDRGLKLNAGKTRKLATRASSELPASL